MPEFYRDPETGEPLRFDLRDNTWSEVRCDASTQYKVRWVKTRVTADQARWLNSTTSEDVDAYCRSVYEENRAARGELLLGRVHQPAQPFTPDEVRAEAALDAYVKGDPNA